jgi:leucyl-tRNA synthetase
VADKFGVDVVRMYLMFMGPFDSTMAWNENTLMGVKRFLDRFGQFIRSQNEVETDSSKEVKVIINKLIKGITDDLSNFKYNTAIAKMMEAINSLLAIQPISLSVEDIKILLKLIAPLAPYTAEEMWALMVETHHDASLQKDIKEYKSVHLESWPEVDEKYLVEDEVSLPVAVNGKVRDQLIISSEELKSNDKDQIIVKAKEQEQVKKWIGEGKIVKEIYVPGKMINLVVQ